MSSFKKSKKCAEMFLRFLVGSFVCLLFLIHAEKAFSRCGDVDGDGNIFSNDVLMVARASIRILTLDSEQLSRTDVYISGAPDGQILSNDLLIIARASLGMVVPKCAGSTCSVTCCSNTDCTGSTPYCTNESTTSSQCVQCTSSTQCQSGYTCESNICKSPNTAPVITSTAIATATVGIVYAYDVNATDADGDTLSYLLSANPTGMTINSSSGLITWTPSTAGSYNLTVSVSDGKGGVITQSCTIIVSSQVTSNPTTVSTGVNTDSTCCNNTRKLVRDSVGNLYLAYHKGSPSQIYVAKSTDNGNTWADIGGTSIQTISGYYQYSSSIAIDSQDNLHVVWNGRDSGNTTNEQIKYTKYSGGSWSVWTNIQTISGYHQDYPSIAIDFLDNLHVVWMGIDGVNTNPQIKYSKYSAGSWSVWTNIQTISGYGQYSPSIAIDSQNNLHVVWEGTDSVNTSSLQIKYTKYSGGSWSVWTNIQTISGYHQDKPSIAVDSSNNLHVVWEGADSVNPSYWQIKYSKYSAGSWSVWTNIQTISGYGQYYYSIAIDSQDNLHVVWEGADTGNPTYTQIKYSACTANCQIASNWSAWVNKTSSTTAYQANSTLRWSRWNNNGGTLDWAWMNGTTVMFNKDATVNMSP